jgi:hypothetical protein
MASRRDALAQAGLWERCTPSVIWDGTADAVRRFDHGCDAINTTVRIGLQALVEAYPSWQLEVLLCAAALNIGQGWWTVASQVGTLANFYLTTWEEYHTGVRSFRGTNEV